MHIRRACLADAEAIAAIANCSPTAPCWTPAQYAGLLSAQQDGPLKRAAWLAEQAGTVTGFAVLSLLLAVEPAEIELESIAVAPQARRHGTGRALLEVAAVWAVAQGADRMRLEVRGSNTEAVAFYTALGFRPSGTRRGYYAAPVEDAVCMELFLQPSLP